MHDFSRFICCGTCRQVIHNPKACVECAKLGHRAHYCNAHRHTCVVCGQTVCETHRTEHATTCVSNVATVEPCAVWGRVLPTAIPSEASR